jgi:Spy/CpxP family protein refolding chaperone
MKKRIVFAAVIVGAALFMTVGLSSQETKKAPEPKAGVEHLRGNPLDLTSDQQAKLEVLRKSHQAQSQALQDEMDKVRDEFRSLRDDPKADPNKANALIDRMAKLRADQMKVGFQHRRDFESILTPEQRDKMTKFHDRVREFRGMSRGFGSMLWERGFGRGFGRGLFQGFRRGFERGFGRLFGRPGVIRPWHHRPTQRRGHGWWRF